VGILFKINILINFIEKFKNSSNWNGDWGLGIGDWAPIPNPQSPIFNKKYNFIYNYYKIIFYE
jgi:hypothetical protein